MVRRGHELPLKRSTSVACDYAGNLVDDGVYYCQYDPWNRLVKVRAKLDAVTIQTVEYDE